MEFNYFSGINHLYSRAKSILLPLLRVIGTFISNELSNCITWKACQVWILQHRWKDICCFKLLDMMRIPLPLARNGSSLSKIKNKPSLVLMISFCSCWFLSTSNLWAGKGALFRGEQKHQLVPNNLWHYYRISYTRAIPVLSIIQQQALAQ